MKYNILDDVICISWSILHDYSYSVAIYSRNQWFPVHSSVYYWYNWQTI